MPDLAEINLQGAKLVRFDLSLCNLANAHLEGAYLRWAKLQEANLQRADLQGANLRGANLRGAKLQGANLLRAELRGAKLQEANLQRADLQGADLQGAYLRDVQITDAHKTAASVIWVDFTKTKYDFDTLQEQLPDMFGHKILTKLPVDMKVPDHWSEADMDTTEGRRQYNRDWEAFKKEKGIE